jgi:hypothetical protein
MAGDAGWATFRDIDRRRGAAKGTAFRAFKALAPRLTEGVDFRVLAADADRDQIEDLRHAGRIYASSRNVVLLSTAAAAMIYDALP